MSSTPVEPGDLLDLKLMPSWLKEPADPKHYEHYKGDEEASRPRGRDGGGRPPRDRGDRPSRPRNREAPRREGRERRPGGPPRADRPRPPRDGARPPQREPSREIEDLAGRIKIRFMPHEPVLANVIAQIQSDSIAYSVFGLARLFLEKPERYDVHLAAEPETSLYQLGENPAVSADQQFLESSAFRVAQSDFYKVDVVQTDPIKGNFSSVARCRTSGTVLGPTNHHAYQPRLRSLYEQRFSRRMSFPEYQRQIEIISDPAVVEQWKEEARNVTTYTTLKEETPATFNTAADAERHFRQNYLPDLIKAVPEQTADGRTSRQLPDKFLRRFIEEAWSKEMRSPSQMMQELSKKVRDAGLQIFRHRKGMLFVTSVRVRPFPHEQTGASPQVQAILQTLTAAPGTHRKDLAEKILADVPAENAEARKLALASDLKWLISEGYVIEFNDGSLDLPRAKVKSVEVKGHETPEKTAETKMEGGTAEPPSASAPDSSVTDDSARQASEQTHFGTEAEPVALGDGEPGPAEAGENAES